MPEHHPGTPPAYTVLESFLWRDFADVDEWISWTLKHGLLTKKNSQPDAFRRAMILQAALRSLESTNNGAPCDKGAISRLNQAIKACDIRPIVLSPGSAQLRPRPDLDSEEPIATLLTLVLDAMRENVWHRFKLCREPTCKASFYDSSKSATKTWCSMERCGSRNKMRRLRAKRDRGNSP
jgi:predicted RNA-binding Zn ribbon-like protein